LLAFASGTEAPPGRIDVHQAIREVVDLVGHRRMEIHLALEAPHSHVHGEPARLTSLLLNLAVNARDAMPNGGVLTIATACRGPQPGDLVRHAVRGEECLEIRVADTGVGISEEVKDRIWEPLFTTKGKEGTGLGMVQVDEALVALGGAVAVHSLPGQGTVFTIWLPLFRSSTPDRGHVKVNAQTVQVAGTSRVSSELRAASLAGRGSWSVEAINADDSSLYPAMAMVVEAAVEAQCRARHPQVPMVVLGEGEDNPDTIHLPSDCPVTEIVKALDRINRKP
jgi:hypothetical protein